MKKSLETVEPFIGHYTGSLSVFMSQDGKRYTFNKPHPRIEKGRFYVAIVEAGAQQMRLVPVVLPEIAWGHHGRTI